MPFKLLLSHFFLLLLIVGCEEQKAQPSTTAKAEPAPKEAPIHPSKPILTGLSEVPSNLVCMVNNQFMGVDQILVEVEGKKYYGCCENCKKILGEQENTRAAVDPVSKKTVDKASAIIGRVNPGNGVYYFESLENLKIFSRSMLENS